jgi:hypothetical protein
MMQLILQLIRKKNIIQTFLYNHENIYCKANVNKNEEKVFQFKLIEKKRLGRKVKCCCEERNNSIFESIKT